MVAGDLSCSEEKDAPLCPVTGALLASSSGCGLCPAGDRGVGCEQRWLPVFPHTHRQAERSVQPQVLHGTHPHVGWHSNTHHLPRAAKTLSVTSQTWAQRNTHNSPLCPLVKILPQLSPLSRAQLPAQLSRASSSSTHCSASACLISLLSLRPM